MDPLLASSYDQLKKQSSYDATHASILIVFFVTFIGKLVGCTFMGKLVGCAGIITDMFFEAATTTTRPKN
jgi:hypothetical protein